MSRRVTRVDPFRLKTPVLPAFALAAGAAALFAAQAGRTAAAAAAAVPCLIAVLLATKPALSCVFAVFGLLGGIVTFFIAPSPGLSPLMRVLAAAGFSLFYMVLMDGVVIAVCAIYNAFTRLGFGGVSLDFERRT
ncbi:MAG: hypothetical protein HY403_02595 [Elusimicrobia bacterium]|nr:hypothetical protein [Elusimicrobiota bacterium]